MDLLPLREVLSHAGKIVGKLFPLLPGKSLQHDFFDFSAILAPKRVGFPPAVGQGDQFAAPVGIVFLQADESALLQRFQHPGNRGRIYLEIFGQLPLATGAVCRQIGYQFRLARTHARSRSGKGAGSCVARETRGREACERCVPPNPSCRLIYQLLMYQLL